MKTAPCKGCEKRQVGCHATCEDYLELHAERVKICAEQQKQKKKTNAFMKRLN